MGQGTPHKAWAHILAMQVSICRCFACAARLAQGNSSVRDVRMAMSVMEIHAESISDLLSAEPHRRLEVKKVHRFSQAPRCCPDSRRFRPFVAGEALLGPRSVQV